MVLSTRFIRLFTIFVLMAVISVLSNISILILTAEAVSKISLERKKRKIRILDIKTTAKNRLSLKKGISDLRDGINTVRWYMSFPEIETDLYNAGIGGSKTNAHYINSFFPGSSLDRISVSEFDYEKLEGRCKIMKNIYSRSINKAWLIYGNYPSITPAGGRITSFFGTRINPVTRQRDFHKGLDIAGKRGTKVVSTANGRVIFSGYGEICGNKVAVMHNAFFITGYSHLEKRLVREGQYVSKGAPIGIMGNSGRSTGRHLHYEVTYFGENVDPLLFTGYYFNKRGKYYLSSQTEFSLSR